MNTKIADVVAGRAGLAGVQWALLGAPARRALRHALRTLLEDPGLLGPCGLRRAKYKPGRHLTAYYDVHLRSKDGTSDGVRPIEVTWVPEGTDDPRGPLPDRLHMQAEALHRGLAAPFQQLMAELPSWGMRVQVAPIDITFQQLVRVCDPAYAHDMLARAATSHERAGAAALAPRYAVTSIRYRPGQRHVLRYDPLDGAEHPGACAAVFAKIYNSDKGARTFHVATRVADWLLTHGGSIRSARPWAYLPDDNVVLYPCVSGTPLSSLLRRPTVAHLRRAGAALQAVHRMPTTLVDLQAHAFAAEVKAIARAAEHVEALLPAVSAQIHALLERARELHERLPQDPPGFAYGDFKADHLWITPDGITLMDFDTCYLADQAIDVGKFLADLRWWYDGYGHAGVEGAQEHFLAGYADNVPHAFLARARLYEALVLVKSTVRRVRLFDRDWAPRTARLVDQAEAVLNKLQATIERR